MFSLFEIAVTHDQAGDDDADPLNWRALLDAESGVGGDLAALVERTNDPKTSNTGSKNASTRAAAEKIRRSDQ